MATSSSNGAAKQPPMPSPLRFSKFFQSNMRILVTGGAGFIGSHLVDKLMENEKNEVIVVDNFFTGSKDNLKKWIGHPRFELIRHDVTEQLLVEVDQIYHLACPASPIFYKYNPVKTIKTNVIGTLNMLGLAKRVGARILLTSTSEVYGDPLVHPQPESYWGNVNPIGVRSCYDEGKRVAETLMFDYHRQHGIEIRIARIFNTYGPRMNIDDGRVVSNFIAQAIRGEPLTVQVPGTQTRSFCYVSDMALRLYDRARTQKWRLDTVTFSTLIKMYGLAGNYDGCLNVYQEMKVLAVKPNMVIYNTLLDAMGRAKRPWQAKTIYTEMTNDGFSPNWATYASLLRAYGRGRYSEDALLVYKEMKEKGMEMNTHLYNTLLAMCADLGLADEAFEIFEDMKSSATCLCDSWTFSSMITIYSCSGNVSEAERMLNEMIETGFQPTIYVLTSLVQCYGKVGRTDDVVKTFDQLLDLGISPDDRFCGCLLNVMTQTPKEELGKLKDCVEKANPKLGSVVRYLVEGLVEGDGEFRKEALELFNSIADEVKKPFCNSLIDLCVNLNLLDRACELLDLGLTLEIYTDIQSKSQTQWSLHLRSLSLGASLTALHAWINDLSKTLESGENLPPLLGINTGHGKHRYSDKGLASVVESHLNELNAPFHEAPDKAGWFLTTQVAAKSWLESRELVTA